jgi:Methylase involved in ubiquinone/menaquinone biosynthesis
MKRADYGLDAPGVVRNLGTAGILLAFVAMVLPVSPGLKSAATWMSVSFLLAAFAMIASSRFGKMKARDSLLDAVAIKPGDTVLDVGCGRGLLLMGAAKRATTGRAIGLDLWSNVDQMNNSREATIANADAEGVSERVEVKDGDMRSLPFADASIDAVVSSLAIHNLDSEADRETAIREIARVLKSGGRVGILDIANVGHYANTLKAAGLRVTSGPQITPWIFPPSRTVIAVKE